MLVEFLRAWENGTWDTQRVDVPDAELADCKVTEAGDDTETLGRWARQHLADQAQYRRVVVWTVYCLPDD